MSEGAYRRRPQDGRTREQREANILDCDIHRLICRAFAMAEGDPSDKTKPQHGNEWNNIALLMDDVRIHLRAMMHADDRKDTER